MNPDIVTDKEFTAHWLVDSVEMQTKVFDDAIVHLPPLDVNFVFDLDNTAMTPTDWTQADYDANFWLNLLWEQIIPSFNFNGAPDSERGIVYVADRGKGALEFIGDGREACQIYDYMKKALEQSQEKVFTIRKSIGEFFEKETGDSGKAPPVWVILRWHSIEDVSSIENDYRLDKLYRKGARVFVLVFGRSNSPPIHRAWWQYYASEWKDKYRAVLKYVFVSGNPSDIGGQLEEFRQYAAMNHIRWRVPIQIPKLPNARQIESLALLVQYGSNAQCQVVIDGKNLRPSGTPQRGPWKSNLVLNTWPCMSSLALVLSALFFLGLVLLKYNPFGVRDEINKVLDLPDHRRQQEV